MSAPAGGVIIAAPASGSGKTVLTLGLLRHLADRGLVVSAAKVGPDYIDPAFHAAAGGTACLNLDAWAMRPERIAANLDSLGDGEGMVVCEGVMGLFDGATVRPGENSGSTADIARLTGWPVVLVVDASAQAASAAAVVRGFATHADYVSIAGVIFNRVGSAAHEAILRDACGATLPEIPVLGCLPRQTGLSLPERHLGLVQAIEHPDLEAFIVGAAGLVTEHIDVAAILRLAHPGSMIKQVEPAIFAPFGQRIAIAADAAFAFIYAGLVEDWRRHGVEVSFFSPLADEPPSPVADAVYLPGGYPELYAGRLAAATDFLGGLRTAAERGAFVFGECGGYMILGDGLVDADGERHAMAGLLPLETSFAERRLHLGYRRARLATQTRLGAVGTGYRGHEFHYASILREAEGAALFDCANAAGDGLGPKGLVRGSVAGSFIHLIDHD